MLVYCVHWFWGLEEHCRCRKYWVASPGIFENVPEKVKILGNITLSSYAHY